MQPNLIAKVLPTKADGKRTIGTGYPITKDLVITARHVVFFEDRNLAIPILIEWPDLKGSDSKPCKASVSSIIDFGEQYDVVLLKCDVSEEAISLLPKLALRLPNAHETWAGLGYPRIGKDEVKRKTVSALGKFHPPNNTHEIQLTSESDAIEKAGWCGISGAPVFNGSTLYAVISKTPEKRKECFTAILIPWMINNVPEFSIATGINDNTQYIADQKAQIKTHLNNLQDSKLFHELVSKLKILAATATPDTLYEQLCETFEIDPMRVFDLLLQASADTLKQENNQSILESIHKLFCLFASLTAPTTTLAKNAVFNLPVYTKIKTEVNLAAHFNTNPIFKSQNDEVCGKYAEDASVFTRETGWDVKEFQNEAVKVTALMIEKTVKDPGNAFERQKLNSIIKQRQNKSLNQLHRFELNANDENSKHNPLFQQDFCDALNAPECLPDMPIVRYGEEVSPLEADLCAKIEEFIELLIKYGYGI